MTYRATVDVPARFRKSKSVGAVFGLTCAKYQSGEIDRAGAISRCGDEMMRVIPTCPLAFVPTDRSFAADAHDYIMVWVLGPTGYKVVARLIAPASGLPSDRHSDRSKRAVVVEAARLVRRH